MSKIKCIRCHKPFHPKGICAHNRHCKLRRPPNTLSEESVNMTALSPHASLIKKANEYWESLFDHQKLRVLAFAMYTSDGKGL
jgi:hypothetical protein